MCQDSCTAKYLDSWNPLGLHSDKRRNEVDCAKEKYDNSWVRPDSCQVSIEVHSNGLVNSVTWHGLLKSLGYINPCLSQVAIKNLPQTSTSPRNKAPTISSGLREGSAGPSDATLLPPGWCSIATLASSSSDPSVTFCTDTRHSGEDGCFLFSVMTM